MPVTIIGSPHCLLHQMGDEHPERPARLHAINDQLMMSRIDISLQYADAPAASKVDLLRAHSSQHVEKLFNVAPASGSVELDADTLMVPETLSAALHAAGAGVAGVDLVMNNQSHKVFCPVRPPGHHATHDQAGGFCFFNNIAIAARYAIDIYGLERVAIIDFDVHHGNGTEDIFKNDERVMLCSSFQHPLYPFSGEQPTKAHILNTPLDAGISGSEYREIIAPWFSELDDFAPQLVLISAGFDAHVEDAIAQLQLVEADFEWITARIREIAEKHAKGRMVSMLEGGYACSALARSVVAHLKVLLD